MNDGIVDEHPKGDTKLWSRVYTDVVFAHIDVTKRSG